MELTQLSPTVAVSPQIQLADIRRLAADGYKGIINNRPDHEGPDQPRSDELEAEALRNGLIYRHIPITPGHYTEVETRAFAAALKEVDGPVLAFCRTGNRSTALWKAAQQAS